MAFGGGYQSRGGHEAEGQHGGSNTEHVSLPGGCWRCFDPPAGSYP